MKPKACIAICQAYEAKFGNISEIASGQLLGEAVFFDLLARAIAQGKPLDQAAIRAAMPDATWDECIRD